MSRRRMTATFRFGVFLATCALALAGCGGSDKDDDGGSSAAPEVRKADLDLGGINPVGSDVPKTTGDDLRDARVFEAERVAERLVDHVTIDERFQQVGLPTGPLATPQQLTAMFASEDPKLFSEWVSGAVVNRQFLEEGGEGISVSVLTFDTEQVAARFVKNVGDQNEGRRIEQITKLPLYGEPTSLPGHPAARTSLVRVQRESKEPSLIVVTAAENVVIYIFSTTTDQRLATTKGLAGKLLTAQLDSLEGFDARRLHDVLQQPVEHRDVRELVLGGGGHVYAWGPNGALHQQTTAGELRDAFDRAELDVMAQGAGANVYRTGSAKQAARLARVMIDTALSQDYEKGFTPKGLRDATCLDVKEESQRLIPNCIVPYGRYVLEAGGKTPPEAQQRISAQYLVMQEQAG